MVDQIRLWAAGPIKQWIARRAESSVYTKNVNFTLTAGNSSISGHRVGVVVLCADLRGFSVWSLAEPASNVAELVKIEYERVIQISNDCHPCFHKFLGDGFILLWEIEGEF